MADLEITEVNPDDLELERVLDLYEAVGWSAYTRDPETLRAALRGSTRVVVARDGAELVGLARVISDGASIAYLQDILVRPGRQREGIGKALFQEVMEPYAHVRQKMLLTDDEPAQQAFYEHLGFRQVGSPPLQKSCAFARFDQ